MIVVTTPYLSGHRVAEIEGHGLRPRRPQPRPRRQPHGQPALARRRRDPRVHEPARGHPPPGARSARQERDAARARTRSSRCASTARRSSGTMSEIVAYGTAVVVVPDAGAPPCRPSSRRRRRVTAHRAASSLAARDRASWSVGGLVATRASARPPHRRPVGTRRRARPDRRGAHRADRATAPTRPTAAAEPPGPGRRRADRPAARAALPADRRDLRRSDDRPPDARLARSRPPASGATVADD